MIEKLDTATTRMVEYLEKKVAEKESEIKELSQEIGSLKAKLEERNRHL